ncbi:MAG: hypothetical protein AAFN10_11120 [Bacteroidota bacterium]
MERFSTSEQLYQAFNLSAKGGFLPLQPAPRNLDGAFPAWEKLAQKLPDLIARKEVGKSLKDLTSFDIAQLTGSSQQEKALQMLAFIGHAYLIENNTLIVPPVLARPWSQIAQRLQRPPVIAHPSYVLHNWYLSVPEQGFKYENLRVSQALVGGKDEAAFILVTVWMEHLGAKAIRAIIEAIIAIQTAEIETVHNCLQSIQSSVQAMKQSFELMRRDCRPGFFYEHIRPYLASFNGLVMQGSQDERPKDYHGGSAAQSSILQSLDAALGIQAPPSGARDFLVKMRDYMPRAHAHFVERLEKGAPLAQFCQRDSKLRDARRECIESIVAFRNEHLKIMAEYIIAPAKNQSVIGTGGTHPSRFLKSVRDASKQSE